MMDIIYPVVFEKSWHHKSATETEKREIADTWFYQLCSQATSSLKDQVIVSIYAI